MPRYLTRTQVKNYARNEIATADDDFIDAAIETAEMTLDRECGRRFQVASGTSARVYAPTNYEVLWIHDAVSVSSVVSGGGTIAAADYQLEPLNALSVHGETVPYNKIRLLSGSWWVGTVNDKEATVTVTASWGWAAIPARITQAALIIAKEIIVNRDEVKLGLVGFSDVGGVVARTNPIVRETIQHYKRVEAFGIA